MRNIPVIVAAFLALAVQVVITPALSIELIRPNALFAFTAVLAIVRPNNASIVTAFALGTVGGLLSSHPLGLMAAVLTVVTFLVTQVFSIIDNENVFMIAASLAIAMFLTELAYGFLLVQFDLNVSFFRLFIYGILPCALYDSVLAFVLYPLVRRFVGAPAAATQIPVAQFR